MIGCFSFFLLFFIFYSYRVTIDDQDIPVLLFSMYHILIIALLTKSKPEIMKQEICKDLMLTSRL